MSIPRIAGFHFVYQFIILTLIIIIGISYIEILPDKKFLFLALIPIFSYQLIIVFCCTELLPLPYWLAWTQSEGISNEVQESDNTDSVSTSNQATQTTKENCVISPIIPRARLYAKNKKSPDPVSSSDANTQTAYLSVSDIFKKAPSSTKSNIRRSNSIKVYDSKRGETNENVQPCGAQNLRSNLKSPSRGEDYVQYATSPAKYDTTDESVESDSTVSDSTSSIVTDSTDAKNRTVFRNASLCKRGPVYTKSSARRSESMKSYAFKRSESGFDYGLDEKDNQPYRPRNWRSLQASKSQANLNSSNQSGDETTEITSPSKLENVDETLESDQSDLKRSFTFPFRQRNPGKCIKVAEDLKNENIPIMQAWNAIDYFNPSIGEGRRKSISTEAIDRELIHINSIIEKNEKSDFTKSLELTKESVVLTTVPKRAPSFNKWKQGVANYFTKTKYDNIKTNRDKQENSKKTPFYKELFLPKDVFCQDSEKEAGSKAKSSPFSKFQNRVKFESHSPSYVSYDDYI